jgi:hypothetical protein
MKRMGIAAAATARKNMLKRSAEWRANRRKDSDTFKASEQMSRDKYNEFTKLSGEFSRTYPNEFNNFLLAKQSNVVALSPSACLAIWRQLFLPKEVFDQLCCTCCTYGWTNNAA